MIKKTIKKIRSKSGKKKKWKKMLRGKIEREKN